MVEDTQNDWVITPEDSYTNCTLVAEDKAVCSEGISVRWARNFKTSEVEEEEDEMSEE